MARVRLIKDGWSSGKIGKDSFTGLRAFEQQFVATVSKEPPFVLYGGNTLGWLEAWLAVELASKWRGWSMLCLKR